MWCLICGVTQLKNVFSYLQNVSKGTVQREQALKESLKEEKKIYLHFGFVVWIF